MLDVRRSSVRYAPGTPPAIDRLSLHIGAGERVSLIGPSGAGKSTLLALASGLTLPSQGEVDVLGVSSSILGHRRHRSTRRRIGTVRQDYALVGPLRVAQNVAAGRLGQVGLFGALRILVRPKDLGEIEDVLQAVGLSEHLWQRADRLSGGQQQRAAIARVLHQAPALLLLDEPVSALDPARSDAVMALLMGPDPDRAVIASLHDADLALKHSTRIVGLREGRAVFDLRPELVTGEMLRALYHLDDGSPT